jgi:hypothetical protein
MVLSANFPKLQEEHVQEPEDWLFPRLTTLVMATFGSSP